MNLLLIAPLTDSRGLLRYHLAAQVDVSGLVKDCAEMPSLRRLLDLHAQGEQAPNPQKPSAEKNDELRELSEMLNQDEMATIRRYGGQLHQSHRQERPQSLASTAQLNLDSHSAPNTSTVPQANGSLRSKINSIYKNVSFLQFAVLHSIPQTSWKPQLTIIPPLLSSSSSARLPACASSSPPPASASLASSSRPSWTKSAAPPASATNSCPSSPKEEA